MTSFPSRRMSIDFLSNVIMHPLSARTGRDTNGFSARSSNMCASFSFSDSVATFRSHLYWDLIIPPFAHAARIPTGLNLLFSVSSVGDTQWIVVPLSAIASFCLLFMGGSPRFRCCVSFNKLKFKHFSILVSSRPCQVRAFP
jgi:hypothetical protein